MSSSRSSQTAESGSASARYRRRLPCMSSPAPSARFPPPRDHRPTKGTLAVRIGDSAFAIFFDFEAARECAKLAVREQKTRIARTADGSLIDEKCVGNQNPAGPERTHKIREQRAVEEIYIHDGVERFVLEMKVIQVCNNGPDGKSRLARSRREKAHRLDRVIDRDNFNAHSRERECVAPASRGNIEHDAARHSREHLDQERFSFTRCLPAMTFIPLGMSRSAHSTRASVKTSTEVAPAASRTRAHSSTVAPVVITSSTISTRRFLMRSGFLTMKARRMFLIRSS